MEESTTDATTQDIQALETAQPEESYAEAATTDSESNETTDQTQSETEAVQETGTAESDFDYDSWLEKKGIDPTTPEGKAQIAKSWRAMEQKMHQSTQQASELEKQINSQPLSVDTDNELLRQSIERTNALETTLTVQQWKAAKQITPEQDTALGKYVVDNPNVGLLLKNGYLNLDQLYAMSGIGAIDVDSAKKQGGKEALQQLESKQRASAPQGNAVISNPPAGLNKSNVEQWWDGLGSEGRRDPANRAKLDSILG